MCLDLAKAARLHMRFIDIVVWMKLFGLKQIRLASPWLTFPCLRTYVTAPKDDSNWSHGTLAKVRV
jgi:hypothetical protein